VKYETISVTAGADMPRPLANWMIDTLNLKYSRKNGAVLGLDYNFKEVTRRSFFNGLLTEVVFPELDAASKEPAYITLKISPEYTRVSTTSGATMTAAEAPTIKKAVSSNFRVTIDGLDMSHVTKVEAIDVKMKVASASVGEQRDYEKLPANLEFPNIVFYIAEDHSDSIAKWHEDFVVNGHNTQDKEKNGRIDVLAANLQQIIYSLELKNLGMTRFTAEPMASDDKARRVRVEMYVEQVRFAPGTMTSP
jgi:phage tail-like protein